MSLLSFLLVNPYSNYIYMMTSYCHFCHFCNFSDNNDKNYKALSFCKISNCKDLS